MPTAPSGRSVFLVKVFDIHDPSIAIAKNVGGLVQLYSSTRDQPLVSKKQLQRRQMLELPSWNSDTARRLAQVLVRATSQRQLPIPVFDLPLADRVVQRSGRRGRSGTEP